VCVYVCMEGARIYILTATALTNALLGSDTCVCVCVCERERETERQRKRVRKCVWNGRGKNL